MASTYSTRLRLELQTAGENDSTWGAITNTNLGTLIEEAIAGVAAVSMTSDANYTLTTANGSTDEARRAVLSITSTVSLTATRNITVPTVTKLYLVYNNTTGGQSLTIKTSAGTGITVSNGKKAFVYCDGTNVVDAVTELPANTVTTTAITNGAVTLAKIVDATATNKIMARYTASSGDWEEAGISADLEFNSGSLRVVAFTGDVTKTAGGTALTIANDAVTYAKMQNVSATSRVLGRITSGAGDVEELTAANLKTILSLVQADISGLTTADSPQFTAINVGHATDTTITRVSAGVIAVEGVNVLTTGTGMKQGLATIPILAAAMQSATTNGAATGTAESTTNKILYRVLDFDQTTQEFAGFVIPMPKSYNNGTVTFQPIWTAASGSGGVVWALQAVALSDDDAIDTAYGTEQTSTDTLIATGDVHIGPTSAAITIAGTPAAGDLVFFRIKRNPSDGSDTLTADARLIAIRLFFTQNASDDT